MRKKHRVKWVGCRINSSAKNGVVVIGVEDTFADIDIDSAKPGMNAGYPNALKKAADTGAWPILLHFQSLTYPLNIGKIIINCND
jgi:hypothetical protein